MENNGPSSDALLEAGLRLIQLDLPIFPVGVDKTPFLKWRNGPRDYVVDPVTSSEWERLVQHPRTRGIAVLGSKDSGSLILDIEKAGMSNPTILAALGLLPDYCKQESRNGGQHAYLIIKGGHPGPAEKLAFDPSHAENGQPTLLAERRGHGSYAVIVGPGRPPLPTDFAPAVLPRDQYDEVEAMIREAGTYTPKPPPVTPYKRTGVGGGTGDIITEALESGALSPLAVLAEGWKVVGHDLQGRQYVRRPHGESETSGNVLDGVVVIHSTAVDWAEPGRPMSGAETLARSRFGGDFAAAMRWVEATAQGSVDHGVTSPAHWPVGVLEAVHETRAEWGAHDSMGSIEAGIDNPHGYIDWSSLWTETTVEHDVLIPQILTRGGSAVLFSASGAGKSLLALDLSVNLALGGFLLGEQTKPTHVLYVDLEQDVTLLRERLEALGVGPQTDLSRLHYSLLGDWPPLDTEEGGKALVDEAIRLGVDLVVIDTTSRVIEGAENDADTFIRLYRHTGRRLKAAGIALLRLDHSGKDARKGQRGSSAKDTDVDQIYRLTQVSDTQVNLKREKNRLHFDGPELIGLKREQDPLRHVLKTVDTTREAKMYDIVTVLDTCDAPLEISRRDAIEVLKNHGIKARTALIGEALRSRRLRSDGQSPWTPAVGGCQRRLKTGHFRRWKSEQVLSLCRWRFGGGSDAWEAVDACASQPVAGSFEGEDVGVVHDPVDHRCGHRLVAEYPAPAAERQVGGEDQGCVFVA